LFSVAADVEEWQDCDRPAQRHGRGGAGRRPLKAGETIAPARHGDDMALALGPFLKGLSQGRDLDLQCVILDHLFGHTCAIRVSLVTSSPFAATSVQSTSTARLPSRTGAPARERVRWRRSSLNGPKVTSSIAMGLRNPPISEPTTLAQCS